MRSPCAAHRFWFLECEHSPRGFERHRECSNRCKRQCDGRGVATDQRWASRYQTRRSTSECARFGGTVSGTMTGRSADHSVSSQLVRIGDCGRPAAAVLLECRCGSPAANVFYESPVVRTRGPTCPRPPHFTQESCALIDPSSSLVSAPRWAGVRRVRVARQAGRRLLLLPCQRQTVHPLPQRRWCKPASISPLWGVAMTATRKGGRN